MMLQNKLNRVQKDLWQVHPKTTTGLAKGKQYSMEDWTIEDVKKVVFPAGRTFFAPIDKNLVVKWNQTDWRNSEYLSVLTVQELKQLEQWLEK